MVNNSKILILAANGMAGHVISKVLENNANLNVFKTLRGNCFNSQQNIVNLELKDQEGLKELIANFQPDYIVNCAGILVRSSDNDPAEAIYINSYLPNFLNKLSDKYNFKLIHISTDCVFSGNNGHYTEQDIPDATNIYGRTKTLGEINNNKHLTIRSSIIGPELKPTGAGLMHWLFHQSGDINGFTKAIWSGVTTLELAKFIEKYIISGLSDKIYGIYHLTNNQSISKYDLLSLIQEVFNLSSIKINPTENYTANKSFINTRNEINKLLAYSTPSYRQMLVELREFMFVNKSLYKQYKLFDTISV